MTEVRNNIEEGIISISKFLNIQGVREKEPLFEGAAQKARNNRGYSGITGFGRPERDGNLIRLGDTSNSKDARIQEMMDDPRDLHF